MTLGELGQRMSSAEFSEWMSYAELEPFGPRRDDARAGVVASVIANVNRDATKRPQAFTPEDFFPSGEPRPMPTAADRTARLKLWAADMNARAANRKRVILEPK